MRGRLEEAKEQLKNVQEVVERAKEESDGMMESMRTKLEEVGSCAELVGGQVLAGTCPSGRRHGRSPS